MTLTKTLARTLAVVVLGLGASALAQRRGGDPALHPKPALQPLGSSAVPNGAQGTHAPLLRSWVTGWALTGSKPGAYEVRCDDIASDCGVPILRTRAGADEPLGMGSLTHSEPASLWRGRRVKLTAELRAGRIDGWAGLWMRIDGADGTPLAFDNMQDRPLRGTTSFRVVSVVLDVPEAAERLSFGVLLHGPGAVFIRSIDFDEVDEAVAVSDLLGPLQAARARRP